MTNTTNNSRIHYILWSLTILGIWMLVLQNAGVLPTEQSVYVNGGSLNHIQVPVDVKGQVEITNMVNMNLKAINGNVNAFCDESGRRPGGRIFGGGYSNDYVFVPTVSPSY